MKLKLDILRQVATVAAASKGDSLLGNYVANENFRNAWTPEAALQVLDALAAQQAEVAALQYDLACCQTAKASLERQVETLDALVKSATSAEEIVTAIRNRFIDHDIYGEVGLPDTAELMTVLMRFLIKWERHKAVEERLAARTEELQSYSKRCRRLEAKLDQQQESRERLKKGLIYYAYAWDAEGNRYETGWLSQYDGEEARRALAEAEALMNMDASTPPKPAPPSADIPRIEDTSPCFTWCKSPEPPPLLTRIQSLVEATETRKPTVPEVLPLLHEYRERPRKGVGGALHLVVDDGNIHDDDVDYCAHLAWEESDREGMALATLLRRMSKTQRRKLAARFYEPSA